MSKQELRNKMLSIVESAKRELRELTDDEKKELEECKREMEDDTSKDDDEKKELEECNREMDDDTSKDDEETPMEEEAKEDEEPSDDETPNEDEKDEEPSTDYEEPSDKDKEKRNKNLKSNNIIMEKKFSLVKAIRNIAENRNLDDSTMAVINAGREEMRKSGLSYAGQIQLPSEKRAIVSVTAEGDDTVATDVFNILDPLRSNLVLAQAGAKVLDNLVGDVKIPVLGASNVGWEGENDDAADGSGAITSVTLKPKRLSCFIDISKQMIAQDSAGVEDAIRRDIVEAIAHKFQNTILGDGVGNATQPSGLFHGLVDKTATDFDSMAAIEADLETANVSNISYIASPKARAAMRAMTKGAKNNAVVAYANGEFDGTPVYSTSDVANSKFLVGDFSNLYLGQWGAIDLVVDNYTQATKGAIRLVVNVYLDAVNARPNSIVSGKFGE